jgi:anti-sigma factor RsiW
MKHDLELKVQAWLDGELPDHEARRIGEWIARDAEASALAAELGCIRQAMLRNETAGTLDESREFYWSKIERQIQREAGIRARRGNTLVCALAEIFGALAGWRAGLRACLWLVVQ